MAETRLQEILRNREKYDGHRTLVTEAEAAEFFQSSLDFVRKLRRTGRLSFVPFKSDHPRARPTIRYRLDALEECVDRNERLAKEDAA
jgi:hypothetical protein